MAFLLTHNIFSLQYGTSFGTVPEWRVVLKKFQEFCIMYYYKYTAYSFSKQKYEINIGTVIRQQLIHLNEDINSFNLCGQ